MSEKLDSVSDVYQTAAMSQRVSNLRQQTDDLQQLVRTRLQSLQDAAKVNWTPDLLPAHLVK